VTTCAWTLRDGSPCRSVALADGLCFPHFTTRQALEAEDAARAARGQPPMSERERERFLRLRRRAQRSAQPAA
jgi:glutamyl/glutaminyl-tRNA synthetase